MSNSIKVIQIYQVRKALNMLVLGVTIQNYIRINDYLDQNNFKFLIPSDEYMASNNT